MIYSIVRLESWDDMRDVLALWPQLIAKGDTFLYPGMPRLRSRIGARLSTMGSVQWSLPSELYARTGVSPEAWRHQLASVAGDETVASLTAYLFAMTEGYLEHIAICANDLLTLSPGDTLTALITPLRLTAQHVVIWSGERDWLLPATFYAASRRLPLVCASGKDVLPALAAHDEYRTITVVGSPQQFDGWELMRHFRGAASSDARWSSQRVAWGILTARHPELALDIAVRSMAYQARNEHVASKDLIGIVADPEFVGASLEARPDEIILKPEDADDEHMRRSFVAENALRSLNLMAHGRDDLLWYRDGLICGKADEHDRDASGERGLPACALSGQCFRPVPHLIDGADIRAQSIFINSCSTVKLAKSTFPLAYNTTMRFLDGWPAACAGSPFMVDGRFFQNLLFHHLFRAGNTVAEAVRQVNNATLAHSLDFPGLTLLGDPTFRIRQAECIPTVIWHAPHSPLELSPHGSRALAVVMPGEAVNAEHGTLYIRYVGHLPKKSIIYSVIVPEPRDGSAIIYLLSLDALPEPLTIERAPVDPLHTAKLLGERFQQQSLVMESMGIRMQEIDRLQQEVRNTVRSIFASSRDSHYHVRHARGIAPKIERLEHYCQHAETALLHWLLDMTQRKNYHFSEEYRSTYDLRLASASWPVAPCPHCGDPLYHVSAQSRLWNLRRELDICPTCGVVDDAPPAWMLSARFDGVSRLYRGVDTPHSIMLANHSKRLVRGRLGIRVVAAETYGISTEPGSRPFELPPGASGTFSFALNSTSDTSLHQYWLRGYIAAEGNIRMIARNIWAVLPRNEDAVSES